MKSDTVGAPSEATPLLGAPESASPPANYDTGSGGRPNRDTSNPSTPLPRLTTKGKWWGKWRENAALIGTPAPQIDHDSKSMPYMQVLVLCYASLAEPVAYFAIFPFINEMLSRNGNLPEENVGYWSGTIESLFSLVQMVLMIFYGRMADRVGRKPILVFSLAGVSLTTALFGMSRTLWQMVVFRCLAGVFAGSVLTVRTMLSEVTTKETQGKAFSWYMFTRNLGIFIGPLVGMYTPPFSLI